MKPTFKLGTRKSKLALTQSNFVKALLEKVGLSIELVLIANEGDKNRSEALYEVEGQSPGLFTKQLEDALIRKEIDFAVHSLKDLPTTQPESLTLAAVTKRAPVADVLILSKSAVQKGQPLNIKPDTLVGTSSLRREAQLLNARPDLRVESIRGNVPTRLDKVRSGRYGGAILAEAGLSRLQADLTDLEVVLLPTSEFVPAPGQGALGIESRADAPKALLEALVGLNDAPTERDTRVERAILQQLEGGCTLPLGCLCTQIEDKQLNIKTFLGLFETSPSGARQWFQAEVFDISGPDEQNLIAQTVSHFKKL